MVDLQEKYASKRNHCCQCSLDLPLRLQERGEAAAVADPGHLQFHRPYPAVPGSLSIAVALSGAPGSSLMTCRVYVLFDLHERLGQYPNALLGEVRVPDQSSPCARAQRVLSPSDIVFVFFFSVDLSLPRETTRGPTSSTAYALYTLTRTLLGTIRVRTTLTSGCLGERRG